MICPDCGTDMRYIKSSGNEFARRIEYLCQCDKCKRIDIEHTSSSFPMELIGRSRIEIEKRLKEKGWD